MHRYNEAPVRYTREAHNSHSSFSLLRGGGVHAYRISSDLVLAVDSFLVCHENPHKLLCMKARPTMVATSLYGMQSLLQNAKSIRTSKIFT